MGNTIEVALERATQAVLALQREDGSWPGDNLSGVTATVTTAVALLRLKSLSDQDQAAIGRWLAAQQFDHGGLPAYPYARGASLNATALATAFWQHTDEQDAALRAAQTWLRRNGGMAGCDLQTRVFLVAAGALSPKHLPKMPVLLAAFPSLGRWLSKRLSFMSVIGMTLVPLMVTAYRDAPAAFSRGWHPLRKRARRKTLAWLAQHQNPAGNWLGAQPFTVMGLLTLDALGETADNPLTNKALSFCTRWRVKDKHGLQFMPFAAEVWNTALISRALMHAGQDANGPALRPAMAYLLKESAAEPEPHDWLHPPNGMPDSGAWAYEADNPLCPDTDTTAAVTCALHMAKTGGCTLALQAKIDNGLAWIGHMQNRDGGWPAFSHGLPGKKAGPMFTAPLPDGSSLIDGLKLLCKPPPELGDPATADLTGRVLEALGACESLAAASAAHRFLQQQLDTNGLWWGRWEVNYLLASAYILRGLAASGADLNADWIHTAISKMEGFQNSDGGWGETPDSYTRPKLVGQGPSDPNVTANIAFALLACDHQSPALGRALTYLLNSQQGDGLWGGELAVGVLTPPEAFYTNPVYNQCAPIEALALAQQKGVTPDE